MAVEVRSSAQGTQLELTGAWDAQQFDTLERELAAVDLQAAQPVSIDTAKLTKLELSGVWALRNFIERARKAGARVSFAGEAPPQLALLEETFKDAEAENADASADAAALEAERARAAEPAEERVLARIGRYAVRTGRDMVEGLAFLGRVAVTALRDVTRKGRLRPIAIARHLYDTGLTAVPIVALIAFLISVIIAYMSATQLRGLGADIYVVDLVAIGVLRELGVLLTSIIVAGRSGSAFAAELGSMKLNEEVDALTATAVDPFEVLVLPRLLGLAIALPLLTVIADLVGLAGGALLCRSLLDMPLTQYVNRVNYAISPSTYWVGLVKAPVFAVLIGLAGCYRGMQVRGSARELGRLVTVAVVQAIFFVILADALFAVLFMEMGI
jgi:phospholipid/cholesterol/gamma-HCH transport system permease protein